jgi:hypothetical protein
MKASPEIFNIVASYKTLSKDPKSQILFFLLSLAFWVGLYVIVNYTFSFKKFNNITGYDIKTRIVGIVHGPLSFLIAAY